MDYTEFYGYQMTLKGLKMTKLAYDCGLDVRDFDFQVYNSEFYGGEDWYVLINSLYQMFDIVECYSSYDDEELLDKAYWMKQAGSFIYDDLENWGVITVLDDRIEKSMVDDVDCYTGSTYEYYYGFAEILPIEKGFIIILNEDDGLIDYLEVFFGVIQVYNQMKKRGEQHYEVEV